MMSQPIQARGVAGFAGPRWPRRAECGDSTEPPRRFLAAARVPDRDFAKGWRSPYARSAKGYAADAASRAAAKITHF